MTTDKTPTDAEIAALYADETGFALGDSPAALLDFARAVLAKWGTPAQAAEPVAWRVHPFDYGIGHEGVYAMTMREDQREAWVRKGWRVEPLFAAPQPVAREPLTPEQRTAAFIRAEKKMQSDVNLSWRHALVDEIEAEHGIKGGQHAD